MDLDTLLQRFGSCCTHVRSLQYRNREIHRDCVKMVKNTEKLLSAVSSEEIECRRMKKSTLAYQEALTRAEESVHNLERYVMMAQLMI